MSEIKTDGAYQLGAWVGRKQAFAEVAGRCSAADAECMRQARESKHYRTLGMNWGEFCKQRMGMSRASADRIIGLLQEFGPQYFVLAQATGINAVEYRRISGAVRGQALLHAGEEIPIQAENTPRLAAAVAELRRAGRAASDAGSRAGAEAGMDDAAEQAVTKSEDLNRTLDQLERTLAAAVSETGRVHGLRLDVAQIERLQAIVLAQLQRMPMVQLMQIVVRK
jgi:hypothetical protein